MVAMAWLVALVLREKHHHIESHENLVPQSEDCTYSMALLVVQLVVLGCELLCCFVNSFLEFKGQKNFLSSLINLLVDGLKTANFLI
jgi:hypothetical protein